MGGAISILSALGAIVAQTAGGPIRLNNVSGRLRASTESGSIVAEVLRGHPLGDRFSPRAPVTYRFSVRYRCNHPRGNQRRL